MCLIPLLRYVTTLSVPDADFPPLYQCVKEEEEEDEGGELQERVQRAQRAKRAQRRRPGRNENLQPDDSENDENDKKNFRNGENGERAHLRAREMNGKNLTHHLILLLLQYVQNYWNNLCVSVQVHHGSCATFTRLRSYRWV